MMPVAMRASSQDNSKPDEDEDQQGENLHQRRAVLKPGEEARRQAEDEKHDDEEDGICRCVRAKETIVRLRR